MGPRITLDTSLALARAVGAWGGLEAKDLRAQIPRVTAAHAAILAVGDAAWPHLAALDGAAEAVAWSDARRAAGARVVVVGEPAAVASVLAIASSGPTANGTLRGLDSLDGAEVDAAFGPGPAPHLLVLEGPDWVAELAESVADRASGWTIAGTGDLLAGADRLPALPEAAFAALSPVAWGICALAGSSPALLIAEARAMALRCAHPALFENPAYLWAAVVLACREKGADRLGLLIPTPRLLPWAAWAERTWGSLTARHERRGGGRVAVATPALVAELGDEARIQQLAGGPMDLLSVALWAEDPGVHWTLRGGLPAWERVRALHQARVRQLSHGARPVLQLRLPSLHAGCLAALTFLTLHSALAVAIGGEGDLRASPALHQWRATSGGHPEETQASGVSRG